MRPQSVTIVTDAPDEAEQDVLRFFVKTLDLYGAQRALDAFMTVITNVTVSGVGIPEAVLAFRRHADLLEQTVT